MSKMIQVRNVPDDIHRELKIRAAKSGMTLSDYLLRELRKHVAHPTTEELLERLASRERPPVSETAAEAVRAEREARHG